LLLAYLALKQASRVSYFLVYVGSRELVVLLSEKRVIQ